ncbi:hypothetical protein Cadr_000004857 [Camelus dromedarius]|uniref:Uncharacterized protein n=1 Tax=Camelus dromedarius TaxID=9838 RepID=A0A5N4EE52_CAMDR|nr:hypothetical protein Cadr_000004857 [Camelus dromedarius]
MYGLLMFLLFFSYRNCFYKYIKFHALGKLLRNTENLRVVSAVGHLVYPVGLLTDSPIREPPQLGEVAEKERAAKEAEPLEPETSLSSLLRLRLDKMSLFSSWIKAIFIIALAFPLYSDSLVAKYRVKSGKLVLHLQQTHVKSQTVMCMWINYIIAPEKWIQSVQPMAKLTPTDAFSAVKSSKIVENSILVIMVSADCLRRTLL